jgi:hypothetical protein
MLRFRDDHVIDTWIGFTADRSWATGDVDQPRVGREIVILRGGGAFAGKRKKTLKAQSRFQTSTKKPGTAMGARLFVLIPLR